MRKFPLSLIVLFFFVGLLPSLCCAQSESALVSTTVATPALAAANTQPGSLALPAPAATPQASSGRTTVRIGIGLKVSTLGIGGEVAVGLAERVNLRAGVNGFAVSPKFSDDGIAYDGRVKLISGDAHLDLFLFRSFRVSPGFLFYNGNNVNAIASVPGGQTFSVGGMQYESSTSDPIAGSGKINFTKVAPEFTVGTGNLVGGHRHWSINTEFGFAYAGAARIALGLTGSACEPPFSAGLTCMSASSGTVAAQVQAQQVKFNADASAHFYYKFWPIVSIGLGYRF